MSFQINHSFFKTYSDCSCYWAGFLAADGNLRVSASGSKCIRVYLGSIDVTHLLKFKRLLESEHKVSTSLTYDRCSFEFCSSEIYDDLFRIYGIHPAKSMTLSFPTEIPSEYLPHFVRGYFDGDGCICESFSNKNSRTATLYSTLLGTPTFMASAVEVISKALDKELPKVAVHPNGFTEVLKLGTKDSQKFLSWMYTCSSEDTRLDRKYDLYHRIMVQKIRKTRNIIST